MSNEIILAKREAKWNDDKERRANVARDKDYYYNNQLTYLKAEIKANYPNSKNNTTGHDFFPFIDVINLTENVTDQLSVLFEVPADIKLDKDSDVLQTNFEQMLEDAKMNPVLQKINKYTNLTKKVGCMPHFDDGIVTLEIITADKVFIEQDEDLPTKAKAVWVQIGISENTAQTADKINTYLRWTAESQQKIEINNDTGLIIEKYEEVDNPYKRIPIVWFTSDIEEDSFWFDSTNILVDKNEIFNQDLTALRYGSSLQSFPTLVLEGFEGDGDIKMGVQRPLKIPANDMGEAKGKVYYIHPNTDLSKIYDYIDKRVIHFINSLGISASSYRSDNSSYSSGYQLKLSKLDVIKKNIADRVYYTKPIKDLCQLMMECYTMNSSKRFPEKMDIIVDYGEMVFDEDPMQVQQINTIKLANNLTSIPRILRKENPDLTEEESEKLANKIKEENNQFQIGTGLEGIVTED